MCFASPFVGGEPAHKPDGDVVEFVVRCSSYEEFRGRFIGVPGLALWVTNRGKTNQNRTLAARTEGANGKGSVLIGFPPVSDPQSRARNSKKWARNYWYELYRSRSDTYSSLRGMLPGLPASV